MAERLLGAAVLAAILWAMFAIPYAFVFILPQALQVAAGFAVVIAAVVGVLDWLVDKRRS
jgi:hypothetical protein